MTDRDRFNRYYGGIFQGVLQDAQRVVNSESNLIANLIRKDLVALNDQLPTRLHDAIIGASDAPNLGQDTPNWAPLSKAYARKKGNSKFFKNTGLLGRYIRRVSASAIFGVPQVNAYTSGGIPGSVEVINFSKGPSQAIGRVAAGFQMKIRGRTIRGGQFVSLREIENALSGTILVVPFPKIPSLETQDAEDIEGLIPNEKIRARFNNPAGKRYRPILSAYLRWWSRTKVQRVISNYRKEFSE